jgi:hypothetical protein
MKNYRKMKQKLIVTMFFVLCTIFIGHTQNIEIMPYSSFQWGGKVKFYEGQVKFHESANYGIAMHINTPKGTAIQLEYLRQPTSIDVIEYGIIADRFDTYEVAMDWYQLGIIKQLPMGKLIPFGGITAGVVHFNPRTNEVDDQVKFSLTGQVGLKYFISDKIGIHMHVRMLMPVQWGGFGFYTGSGGSGTTVSAGSEIIQGDIGGGLIFRLGQKSEE